MRTPTAATESEPVMRMREQRNQINTQACFSISVVERGGI